MLSDAELLIASCRDTRAFREFYDRWAERLLAYFVSRTLDAEVAADLMAETFAVAFERRTKFRDLGKPGGAWLYGIAAKELSHWYRHQDVERRAARRLGLQVPRLDEDSIARIEALADVQARRAELSSALDQISVAERAALELRVVRELEYPEIARQLHCSVGAARVRVHRALGRLNELLEATS